MPDPDEDVTEDRFNNVMEFDPGQSESDEEAYFLVSRKTCKAQTKKKEIPVTLLQPINEKNSTASWSRSGNSSSIEELNARGYKHFKGRRRSVGSQVKLQILEEQRRENVDSAVDDAEVDTASGGVGKFVSYTLKQGERGASPKKIYDRATLEPFSEFSRMLHSSGASLQKLNDVRHGGQRTSP